MHARIGWQNLRTTEFLDSGDYMLITGTDFNDGAISFSTCHYVERARYEQDRNIQIHNGSILITKDGTLGKVAYVQGLSMPATLNAGVFNVQIKDANYIDEKYLFQYLKAPFLLDYIDKKATGGTFKHLNQSILVDFPVILPQRSEQILIGAFFQQLDALITLYQRKYEKLTNVKKSMLEKMFPQNGSSFPEIRFKGFTDAWEQRKLGEMGQTYTGLSGKTKDDFGHGQARFVTYMNVFSNPISNPEMTEPIEIDPKQNEVEVGDVFFTTSSETPEEVGMSSILLEKRGKTYLNSFCFGFRPSEKIDSYYLAYMLRSESARAKITLLAQGISRYNISKNKVMEIAVSLPSLDEQKMIGQYFSQLDNLITLHQRKTISANIADPPHPLTLQVFS